MDASGESTGPHHSPLEPRPHAVDIYEREIGRAHV